jgi:ribonuclease Z
LVLSGDTHSNENLIRFAQGVDLVVREAGVPELLPRFVLSDLQWAERIMAHHTTPEQAGEVCTRVHPTPAVYSHIASVVATADDLIPPTRTMYAGPAANDPTADRVALA